jgi:hypothetical protein
VVCKKLTLEADYRMPRMYPLMVATAVNVTLVVDAFVLGTEVGGAPTHRLPPAHRRRHRAAHPCSLHAAACGAAAVLRLAGQCQSRDASLHARSLAPRA